MAQGRFYGGSSCNPAEAHTRLAMPKIPSVPSASILLGEPQALGNTPHKGVKADRSAPQITAEAHQTRGFSQLSITSPTERANSAQGRFYGGSGWRAEAYTHPALPKIPSVPSAFLLLGAPQAPGNKPNSPLGGKSLVMAPWERRKSPVLRQHPIEPCRPKHVRPKCALNNWRGGPNTGFGWVLWCSMTCIYGGERVHYLGSTTHSGLEWTWKQW